MKPLEDEVVQEAPPRLIEGADRAAALLWRARRTPPPGEPRPFAELMAVRDARQTRLRVGVALVVACLPASFLWWSERSETEPSIAPEDLSAFVAQRVDAKDTAPPADVAGMRSASSPRTTEPAATQPSSSAPESVGVPAPGRHGQSAAGQADTRRALGRESTPSSAAPSTSRSSPSPRSVPLGASSAVEERCSDWTNRGEYAAAAECYARKAQGSGVGAEWALLEKARIHSRAQGKPEEALRALDEYERRFAAGSLAREARLSRIEILATTGRTEQALRALDDVLGRDQIPERTGELLLLRAQLRADSGNCVAALSDLEAAGTQGIAPARASSIRQKCPHESDSP